MPKQPALAAWHPGSLNQNPSILKILPFQFRESSALIWVCLKSSARAGRSETKIGAKNVLQKLQQDVQRSKIFLTATEDWLAAQDRPDLCLPF
jgi:hypothetical protein